MWSQEISPNKLSETGADWDNFDTGKYLSHNYPEDVVHPEDKILAEGIITTLADYLERELLQANSLFSGLDLGTCGVPRLPAMVAPFVWGGVGVHLWSDYGDDQVELSRQSRTMLREGSLGRWETDQLHYAEINPLWEGAFLKAGEHASVNPVDFRDSHYLPLNRYDFVTSGHCIESATSRHEVWRSGVRQLLGSLAPGGLFVMTATLASTGYRAGADFPAVPISLDDLRSVTDGLLREQAFVESNVVDGTRDPDDPHEYSGFGAVVGIKVADDDWRPSRRRLIL